MFRYTSSPVSLFVIIAGIAGIAGLSTNARGDDWPQWRGPNRDGVWRESGIVSDLGGRALKPVWRVPVSGGYSGPTVADGRVFLTDRIVKPKQKERILCFNADTGKRVWTHEYECAYKGIQYDAGPRANTYHDPTLCLTLLTVSARSKTSWKTRRVFAFAFAFAFTFSLPVIRQDSPPRHAVRRAATDKLRKHTRGAQGVWAQTGPPERRSRDQIPCF